MDQKWIQTVVILVFYHKMTSGANGIIVKQGDPVEIHCKPAEVSGMIIWFRVLDKSGMEFIASFGGNGMVKSEGRHFSAFSSKRIQQDILILNSFDKTGDTGIYSCAGIKSNELKFGKVTQLVGEKVTHAVTIAPPTTTRNLSTTTKACICNNNNRQVETRPSLYCTPIILGPLAGACGLLLLLLIITVLYCNKIRTRRCPHHYKRKPRTTAPGKPLMTNRHI